MRYLSISARVMAISLAAAVLLWAGAAQADELKTLGGIAAAPLSGSEMQAVKGKVFENFEAGGGFFGAFAGPGTAWGVQGGGGYQPGFLGGEFQGGGFYGEYGGIGGGGGGLNNLPGLP
jgi:hypothetical protein